eukprot:276872_1
MSTPKRFSWKGADLLADKTILNNLQKYKLLNVLDMLQQQKNGKIPNLESIYTKYLSIKKKYKKCKLILLMRHGEGIHNEAILKIYGLEEWKKSQCQRLKYKDASLTNIGINQAQQLQPHLSHIKNNIQLIVISPLKRAIETAQYSILPMINMNLTKVIVLEYARERMKYFICDNRSSLTKIKTEMKDYNYIQYDGFDTNEDIKWNNKVDESLENLWRRMAKLLDYFYEKRNENIIMYSGHSFAMLAIMQLIEGMPFYKPPNATILPIIITSQNTYVKSTL